MDKYRTILWSLLAILCAVYIILNTFNYKLTGIYYFSSDQISSMIQQIEKDKYVEYVCDEPSNVCGGWGDRMKGILSAYGLSLLLNRKFSLLITKPCNMELILRPNEVDWLELRSRADFVQLNSSNFFIRENFGLVKEFETNNFMSYINQSYYRTSNIIKLKTNLMMINAVAKNPTVSARLKEIGFNDPKKFKLYYQTYNWYKKLFKLAPKYDKKYSSILSKAKPNKSTFLICSQLRIGGKTQSNVKDDTVYTHGNESLKFWQFISEK